MFKDFFDSLDSSYQLSDKTLFKFSHFEPWDGLQNSKIFSVDKLLVGKTGTFGYFGNLEVMESTTSNLHTTTRIGKMHI